MNPEQITIICTFIIIVVFIIIVLQARYEAKKEVENEYFYLLKDVLRSAEEYLEAINWLHNKYYTGNRNVPAPNMLALYLEKDPGIRPTFRLEESLEKLKTWENQNEKD